MSDKRTLPERLRAANSELLAFGNDYSDLLLEAAAEIEKLRSELEWRRRKVQSGCCCKIDEDGETILNWCGAHRMVRDENARLRQSIRDLVTRFDATANHELKWGGRNCGLGWHDAARELEGLLDRHLKARETNP